MSAATNAVHELLAELADLNVKLWAEDNRLRISAPKGVLTSALQDQVRNHKIEILGLLSGGQNRYPKLRPYARTGTDHNEAPLSYAQQRLWFLKELEGDSSETGGYLIPGALQLRGVLDVARLHASLNALVARHESLRTTIHATDGVPVQRIHPAQPIALPLHDLRALPQAQRQAESQRIAAQEMARPFDLAQGPLLRCVLVQTDEREFVLFVLMHHIVADGWSMPIFAGEVAHAYDRPNLLLPALRIQYADFAQWQREWLQGNVLQAQLDYWTQKLTGAPPLLELPTDRPRSNTPGYACGTLNFALSAEVVAGLRKLAQQHGATHYMVALAAFAVLLSRYSNQRDVVIGSPTANRVDPELEQLIGFFVNTLALRVNLQTPQTFGELLQQVKQTTLDAYAHQDTPLEQIVDALHLPRTLSHAPLFQVMFSWLNQTGTADMDNALRLRDLDIAPATWDKATVEFDLVLSISETSAGWSGVWQYSTGLFDEATISRMAAHFENILASIVAQPDAPLSALPLLSEAEAHRMVVTWNESPESWRGDDTPACIHELIAAQAARTPTALALVCGDESLTYAEFDARADAIAQQLNARGFGVGQRIGICAERSIEMMLAVLGVMKAGAAYVPLDPDYPAERLAAMLSDADVSAVVVQAHLMGALPETPAPVLTVEQLVSKSEPSVNKPGFSEKPGLFTRPVTPDDPIYMIYTSGSTGQPKGVLVAHKGVANTVRAIARAAGLGVGDRFLQFVPFAFDASAVEFFTTLLTGATLVLHRDVTRLSTSELHALCEAQSITTVHFTVALWHQWVDNLQRQGLRFPTHLRNFMMGGEKPNLQTLHTWATLGDHEMKFICSYGPTEASIATNIFLMTNHAVRRNPPAVMGLGATIPNMGIYVLDAQQQLAPVGVTGELYLGGVGIAGGYWQREAQTRAHFFEALPAVTTHLRSNAPQCFYRTGDLARWLPDGTCEFVGRADTQVKIRGFRIELGEIEAQIKKLPQVREAVVLAVAFGESDKRVVAYVQWVDEVASVTRDRIAALRTAQSDPIPPLRAVLPPHMLPSAWVEMTEWPLTPNGKLDRKALPAPEWGESAAHYVAPRNETETQLAEIWCEVLNLDRVGIESDFFELGGHSLLAMQVVSRVRQSLNVELPLRALFDAPTIAGLAPRLLQAARAIEKPALTVADRHAPLVLSFSQQRLWLMQQLNPDNSFFNMPLALQLDGPLDGAALQAAFDAMVQRHDILRTTFPLVDGVPVQHIAPVEPVAITRIETTSSEFEMRAFEEAERPFDLQAGPLLRVSLLRAGETQHVLLVTMHHIIGDNWSLQIFMREFTALYAAFAQGQTAQLSELHFQYADFAAWQRQWLRGDALQAQLSYWKEHLADAPALLELPTDRPRPPQQRFVGDMLTVSLADDLVQPLRHLCREHGTTLHMLLLAGFASVLARYSGQDDLVIGIPIAGRNDAQVEPMIGYFLNTLALRIRVNSGMSFAEVLQQVKRVTLDGYANQDAPFEQVIETINPPPQLSHTPLFQVLFDLLQDNTSQFELPGVQAQPVSFTKQTAKFDINLVCSEALDALYASWEFNTDIFERSTIERMAQHWQNLLRAAAAQPTQAVGTLPLLSEAEREFLLVGNNQTEREFPLHLNMAQLFEAQVERTPDAIAAQCEDATLTYAQLNERANRWAHKLVQHGVQAECLVAPFWERNLDFITAILAVFKAGGAYLPMDPHTPTPRLTQILAQSRTPLVLTNSAFAQRVQEAVAGLAQPPQVMLIEALDLEEAPTTNLEPRSTPDNLAYVIFTSGSTGVPKGVMVEQRGLVNHLCAMQVNLGMTPGDVIGQTATQSYVISVWQFLAGLITGARVQIVGEAHLLDPASLLREIERHHISLVQIVPSVMRLLVEALAQGRGVLPACVRWMIPTGEALPPALARTWFAHCPEGRVVPLLNAYGSSECSDDVSHDVITEPPGDDVMNMPAGRPIPNVQMVVLDAHMQPAPMGVAGELYVSGAGVGRGYWFDEALTAQKFVSCVELLGALKALRAMPARLYKTGDRARVRPDGKIEYLGRLDFQVKVRGVRIELGEIETVLGKHPAVAQSVVTAKDDAQGNKQLLAYVVLQPNQTATPQDLRAHVATHLPEYMVPAWVMVLDAFPLNASGKVARSLLPEPAQATQTDAAEYIAPRTETEAGIVSILSAVMGLDVATLGVRHNFFDLGGHSMQAIQVVWQLRTRFGVDLPLRSVFENTTVEGLAKLVDEAQAANGSETKAWSPLVPLQVNVAQPKVYFVHAAGGALFWYLPLLRQLSALGLEVNAVGIQGHGLYGEQQPLQNIHAMAKAYCDAIKQSQPNGPYHLVGYSMGGVVAYEMAQQLRANGDEVGLLALLDTYMFTQSLPYPGHNVKNRDEKLITQMLFDWGEADAKQLLKEIKRLRSHEARIAHLLQRGQQAGLIPAIHTADDLRRTYAAIEAHVEAMATYTPQPYAGAMAFFQCVDRSMTSTPSRKWTDLVKSGLAVYAMPGTHKTLMEEPQVQTLARALHGELRNLVIE